MSIQKCTFTGVIADSSDTPINGILNVSLDAPIVVSSTTPDRLIMPVLKAFTITSGVVNFQLWETETDHVTYHFQLFDSLGKSIFDWHEIVPNAATYEFAQLLPTGITTDRLSTGAYRVAKEILTDPLLNPDVKRVLGIYRQAAPPTATADGDVWIQSTTGTTYVWIAARSQWVGEPLYRTVELQNIAATGSNIASLLAPNNLGGADTVSATGTTFIERIDIRWNVTAAPHTSANKWVIQPGTRLMSQTSLTNIGSAVDTFSSGVAVANLGRAATSFNGQRSDASQLEYLGVTATKTGSPGNLNASVIFTIRYGYPR